MGEMRKYGTGSYDHGTGCWRLRGKGIQVTVKKLGQLFGIDLPRSEEKTRPYWSRYLAMVRQKEQDQKRGTSPLQLRLWSLDGLISLYTEQGRDTAALEAERLRCANVGEANPEDEADIPVVNPEIAPLAAKLDIETTDYIKLTLLEQAVVKRIPRKESLQLEAEEFLRPYIEKRRGGVWSMKNAVNLFTEVAGDISVKDIDVALYRRFMATLENQKVGPRTKFERQKIVHQFLRSVENNHNLRFGFIHSKANKLKCPDGQKIGFSLEQLRLAASSSTGLARTMVLLAANCGFYRKDIYSLVPEHFDGTYIHKPRQKLEYDDKALVLEYKLWPETKDALAFGQPMGTLIKAYDRFAKQHSLPPHKAIRKGVSLLIEDRIGEKTARLYRGERSKGNHGKYYSKLTPTQIKKLDGALDRVHKWLFE